MNTTRARRHDSGKSCGALLHGAGGEFGYLIEHCKRLERMSRMLLDRLPPAFQPHCRVAAIVRQTLILHADSPAWASKLRYYCPQLPAELCQLADFSQLNDLRIKVVPPELLQASRQTSPAIRRSLPPSAARLLREVAATTPSAPLKAALLRLATREKTKS